VDPEAAARAIVDQAKQARRPTPRWLWIGALVVATVCLGSLAIAWFQDCDTVPTHQTPRREAAEPGGFGAGIVLGIGIGALATSAVLLRRR
jgi:anti-sigma factor RsiW